MRLGIIIPEKNKKPKPAQVMCEQVTRIGDIAEASHSSFQSFLKQDEVNCVTSVMDEVIACGAAPNTDEFFMATELFVKMEQREMFLYMPLESRKGWLHGKYDLKYGKWLIYRVMVGYPLLSKLFVSMLLNLMLDTILSIYVSTVEPYLCLCC